MGLVAMISLYSATAFICLFLPYLGFSQFSMVFSDDHPRRNHLFVLGFIESYHWGRYPKNIHIGSGVETKSWMITKIYVKNSYDDFDEYNDVSSAETDGLRSNTLPRRPRRLIIETEPEDRFNVKNFSPEDNEIDSFNVMKKERTSVIPTRPKRNKDLGGTYEIYRGQKSTSAKLPSTTTSYPLSASALLYSLDPHSDIAKNMCADVFNLTDHQIQQIQKFCDLIVEWNLQINLISRVDCNVSTVFGRHVIPSLACRNDPKIDSYFNNAKYVIDVGTGGGFPGLPLAIAYPHIQFTLLDSISKKLIAVQEIVNELQLKNVHIVNERSESYRPKQKYDIVSGRSVTELSTFCSWIDHLLKDQDSKKDLSNVRTNRLENNAKIDTKSFNDNNSKLIYWIGGEVSSTIQERILYNASITNLIHSKYNVTSDKHILVFSNLNVHELAERHRREQDRISNLSRTPMKIKQYANDRVTRMKSSSTWGKIGMTTSNDRSSTTSKEIKKKRAKGEWRKKNNRDDDNDKDDIGYRNDDGGSASNFRRYKS